MKYEIKELIDQGLDVSSLPKDYQADVETIEMLSNDYTTPDDEDKDLVKDLDQKLVAKLKSEGLVKKHTKEKKPAEKKPAEKKPAEKKPAEKKPTEKKIPAPKYSKKFKVLPKDSRTDLGVLTVIDIEINPEKVENRQILYTLEDEQKETTVTFYEEDLKAAPAKKTEKKDDKKPAPKSIDKAIDDLVGKTIYFKPEKDKKWVSGKISNGYPAYKGSKDKWRLEFYPAGGKKWDFPAVSDIFTSEQMQKFLNGEVVKDYTLTKPKGVIISDFEKAQREIDDCLEEAKVERARKQAEDPAPKKKTTSQVFKEKSKKYVAALEKVSKVEKPDKAEQIKKIIEKAQEEIRKILFG